MKALLICVLALATGTFAKIKCPLGENINGWDSKDLLFPHVDCDKYYICVHGEPVEQFCPIGLLYNDKIKQCDWPGNSRCKPKSLIPEDTETVAKIAEPSTVFTDLAKIKCPLGENINGWDSKDLLFPHVDCDKYYICVHGEPVEQFCPIGLLYNDKIKQCDWPGNSRCKPKSLIPEDTETVAKIAEPSTVFTDLAKIKCPLGENINGWDSKDLLFPHVDCDKYYICVHGEPVEQFCPIGLLYNDKIKQCDWPGNSRCKPKSLIPEDTETVAKIAEPSTVFTDLAKIKCPLGENINGWDSKDLLFPHVDCDKYYICVHGEPVEQFCPIGLLYNDKIKQCDWPGNSRCKPKSLIAEDTETVAKIAGPSTIFTDLANVKCHIVNQLNWKKDVLLAHWHCDQYYQCANGVAVTRFCPNGLHFNVVIDTCDYPENVKCFRGSDAEVEPSVVNGPSVSAALAEHKCRVVEILQVNKDVLFSHWDCGKYYICDNGAAVARSCPAGLHFNPFTDTCDYPHNVICFRSSPVEKDTETVAKIAEPSTVFTDLAKIKCPLGENINGWDSKDLLFPHVDCDKYYICVHGEPVEQFCPIGLLYNDKIKQCDWPGNSRCKPKSLIPEDTETVAKIAEPSTVFTDLAKIKCSLGENINGWDSKDLLFPHVDCDKYYICVHGEPVEQFCPIGLLYNDKIKQCDWPGNSRCKPKSLIPEDTETVAKIAGPSTIFTDLANVKCHIVNQLNWKKDVLLAHWHCDQYYQCANGVAVTRFCPDGLHFNVVTDTCDYPENVMCFRGSDAEVEPSVVDGPSVSAALAEHKCRVVEILQVNKDVLFSHWDCGKYYICDNGAAVARSCPAGLHFNPFTDKCDYPHNVICFRNSNIKLFDEEEHGAENSN